MSEILEKFRSIAMAPYEYVKLWKEEHKRKVIGVAPMHLPEELVHATGALPVLLQENDEPVDEGYTYIHPYYCGFVRNIVDMAVKGLYDFFDGLVFSDMCVQTKAAQAILYTSKLHRGFPVQYVKLVQPPLSFEHHWAADDATAEFGNLRSELAEIFADGKIDDKSIRDSIFIYNKNRGLLRKLYEIRRGKPGLVSQKDMQNTVVASMVMPKEEHSKLLEMLISELSEMEPNPNGRVRLYLSGHLCHRVKPEILGFTEDLGGIVVDDDLYTGTRYYSTEDVEVNGDPIGALVKRYLSITVPCPTRYHEQSRWDEYILEKAKACQADGVVILQPKFCEHQMFSYPYQKNTLSAGGMPLILLETEHEAMSTETIRNRVQAFIETLERK